MGQATLAAAGPDMGPAARASGVKVSESAVVAAAVRASGHALTDYQRAFLDDPFPLRVVLKARQTGFSWLFALEALAQAIARGTFSIFVSLNREEAAEKILYARDLYDALPETMRPGLVRGGSHELRFTGGGRLLSFPCRAPRGKARANLYLDEMAFYPNSQAVYSGALPVVSHGGRVTLASTPCGDRGMFWRALSDDTLRGQFSRHTVPWWRAPWFCTDLAASAREAGCMETDERVARFGTPTLRRLRAAMECSAFQQEYEMLFVDSDEALITWEEIESAVGDVPLAPSFGALSGIGLPLYAGMDVGRYRDPTEIVVLSESAGSFTVRALRTMRNAPYQDQEDVAAALLDQAPVALLSIDASGIGGPMSEHLGRRFPGRIVPVTFTLASKQDMATRLHMALQNGTLRLPRLRPLMEQIHAVRRTITQGAHVRIDAPHRPEHHADQFWALALALHAFGTRPGVVQARSVWQKL